MCKSSCYFSVPFVKAVHSKRLFIGLSIVLLVCVLSFTADLSAAEETVRYESPAGITVEYPQSWELEDYNTYRDADPTQMIKDAVAFSAPVGSGTEEQRSGVALTIMDMSNTPQMSAEFMLQLSLKQQQITMSDFVLVSDIAETDVGGMPALSAEYKAISPEGQPIQTTLFYAKHDGLMISVAYTAGEDEFETYLPHALSIIESIQ